MDQHLFGAVQKDGKELTMVEKMDQSIAAWKREITGAEVCSVIREVFGIDLDKASLLDKELTLKLAQVSPPVSSLSAAAIDCFMDHQEIGMSGHEIRKMLNRLFGTNLEGISALHEQRISLYSKEQWIAKDGKDLFIVHTGADDVDAKVIPSAYFIEKTGLDRLPDDLQQTLTRLGYSYNEQIGAYYFCNPSGQAVPDSLKRQTIDAIHDTIQKSYSEL